MSNTDEASGATDERKPGVLAYIKASFIGVLMFLIFGGMGGLAAFIINSPSVSQGTTDPFTTCERVLVGIGAALVGGLVGWGCFLSTLKSERKKRAKTTASASIESSEPERNGKTLWDRVKFILSCGFAVFTVVALIAIATPGMKPDRKAAERNACMNKLRHIESGKDQWSFYGNQKDGSPVDVKAVNEYIKGTTTPVCPSGGAYKYGAVGELPACSVHGPFVKE